MVGILGGGGIIGSGGGPGGLNIMVVEIAI